MTSLTFHRLQTLVATLAIVLVAFAAMVAVCDDCNVLAPDPHCPFCNLANLPMTSPLLGLQFAPPVAHCAEGWRSLPESCAGELTAPDRR
jgi:hypothetical protein